MISKNQNETCLIKCARIASFNKEISGSIQNVLIKDGRIAAIGDIFEPAENIIDGDNCIVAPGFIQTHIHLCQTLFRGLAEDLPLLDWLKKHILPLEAAHDPDSLYDSARLGLIELIRGGVTTFMSMETVYNSDSVFQAAVESGMRAFIGNVLMDMGDDVPSNSKMTTQQCLSESQRLIDRYHNSNSGLVRYAFAPRFVLTCSEELLSQAASKAEELGLLVHSHASENQSECALVKRTFGVSNIEYFEKVGLAKPYLCLAHCIWVSPQEMEILRRNDIKVLHCPGSNLKLGSGIADIFTMKRMGVKISLGADGAPCNNTLDPFNEIRLAGLLQKLKYGTDAISAREIFRIATLGGAECLGIDAITGSIEIGKEADLILIRADRPHNIPNNETDIFTQLVYSTRADDVIMTMVGGKILFENNEVNPFDEDEVKSAAVKSCKSILSRTNF